MKEDIINFIDDFTIELNPKVQKKITDIHINKKNKIFVTYLPESDEKEILSAVEFVDTKGFTPIVHLPARTMRDIDHVEDFLIKIRKLTKSSDILVIGGGGNQVGSVQSSMDILESGLLEKYNFNKV